MTRVRLHANAAARIAKRVNCIISCLLRAWPLNDRTNDGASNERGTHTGNYEALRMRRPEEALRVLDDALRRAPGFVEAMINRGSALRELQRPGDAMASYSQAWALAPARPELHTNVANLMLQLGRAQDALDACDRALQLQPDLTEALNIRAQALGSLDRLREAADTSARLLRVAPDFDYAAGKLFQAKAAACDWSEHRELTARILDGVMAGKRASTPLSLLSVSDSAEAQLRCARVQL